MAAGRVTGHLKLIQRKAGPVVYMKTRVPGRVPEQTTEKIGTLWTGRGRPPAGHVTKKQAEEALQQFLADARRGTIEGLQIRTGRTFGDACAEWLRWAEHDKRVAPSTLSDYRNVVGNEATDDRPARGYLLPFFGATTPIEHVTKRRIEVFRATLLDEGRLSRRTIQKIMVLLYGVMKRAERNDWIIANPAEKVDRVSVKRSGDFNVLSPIEVHQVARHAATPMDAAVITMAAFTGLRMGELRALRWMDIDFASRTIFVRRNLPVHGVERTPKSGKVRSVPLIDQAAVVLDSLSRRDQFVGSEDRVFVSPTGGAVDPDAVRTEFYASLERAGLGRLREKDEPIVFHDLRHTFGTLAVSVWPLHDVQGYMGHADIQTTMIYVHHQPKASAADELSRAVAAALAADSVSPVVSRNRQNGAQLAATEVAF